MRSVWRHGAVVVKLNAAIWQYRHLYDSIVAGIWCRPAPITLHQRSAPAVGELVNVKPERICRTSFFVSKERTYIINKNIAVRVAFKCTLTKPITIIKLFHVRTGIALKRRGERCRSCREHVPVHRKVVPCWSTCRILWLSINQSVDQGVGLLRLFVGQCTNPKTKLFHVARSQISRCRQSCITQLQEICRHVLGEIQQTRIWHFKHTCQLSSKLPRIEW